MHVLLCLLALLAVPTQAQGSVPYALPFTGRLPVSHVIELALGGTAVGEPLTVAAINSPTWLRFDIASVKAVREPEEDPTARFVFSIIPDAPVREAATVELVVTGATGAEQARHAFSVVVEPPALALSAPVPNPSRGGATVSFTTSGVEATRLSVIDVLGREVAVLADGALPPGVHRADVPHLASGSYVVRLVGVAAVYSERFTVVR